MRINFQIAGSLQVPDALCPLDGATNQYRLPTGEVISVHPVIEIASGPDADDHRDLGDSEAAALGLFFDIYDRASDLEPDECSLHRAAIGRRSTEAGRVGKERGSRGSSRWWGDQ